VIRRRYIVAAVSAVVLGGGTLLGIGLASSRTPPSLPVKAAEGTPAVSAAPSASPSPVAYPRIAPTRVIVPSLGINAAVEPVGLCPSSNPAWDCSGVSSGGLATPLLGAENLTGWWEGGYAPGQDGPAVIVGHINSAAAGNLVFANLDSIQIGAMIETEPGNLWFRVIGTDDPPKDAFPTQSVYGPTATPTLRLITCGGAFDSATGHYLNNFVVYAIQA
jgi:Sortase domain